MNFKQINEVVKHYEKLVEDPEPMRPSDKIALKKLAELYQWELVKRDARSALRKLAKARDKGLWKEADLSKPENLDWVFGQ